MSKMVSVMCPGGCEVRAIDAGDRARARGCAGHRVPLRPAPHGLRPDLNVLKRRLAKAMAELDHARSDDDGGRAARRGSSDRQANGEMARWRAGCRKRLTRTGRPGLHRHHLSAPRTRGPTAGAARHEAGRRAALLPLHGHAGAAHRAPGRALASAVLDDPLHEHRTLRAREGNFSSCWSSEWQSCAPAFPKRGYRATAASSARSRTTRPCALARAYACAGGYGRPAPVAA